MRSSLLVTGLLALARAIVAEHTVVESLNGVPDGWNLVARADADEKLHFRIAVNQPNDALLERTIYDVSTPGSARYGKHLGRDELKNMMRPSAESTTSVLNWLRSSGVEDSDVEEDGEWINFYAPAGTAEKMMDTEFHVYQHSRDNSATKVRTLGYSVPKELADHIYMIQPTTRFGQIRAQNKYLFVEELGPAGTFKPETEKFDLAECNQTITPTCLRELYHIKGYKADPKLGFMGINGFLEQYARQDDLTQFLKQYAPKQKNKKFSFQSVNGGENPQDDPADSVEASLDIDYTMSISDPIPNTYFGTAGRGKLIPDLDQPNKSENSNEPYLEFFTYLLNQPDDQLPTTLSTSYGEDEQSVPERYSRKVCNMIGQLGARGVSILFSSGDTGVGSACQTNDGKNTTRFLPIFPAACPFVTSVGGTYKIEPEQAVSFSSGGFSDRFPQPEYQKAAVAKYLKQLGNRWEGLYNPAGKGFPDISGQAYNFHVIDKNKDILVGGTSASAPSVSAIIALINNALKAKGVAPLGFLNPWLYADGYKALTDITHGGSKGCTGKDIYSGLPTPKVDYASWNATVGWDPVTGLGTPDFQKMLESAMNAAKFPSQIG